MPGEFASACIFWGKFVDDGPRWLSLTAHCLDVAVVFRALCDLNGIRRSLQHAAGRSVSEQELDRLAVLAALHDAGKSNLGFQHKVFGEKGLRAGHIRELAPLLDPGVLDEHLHTAFVQALPVGMEAWFPNEQVAYSYLIGTFSHHGRPVQFKGERSGTYWQAQQEWWRPRGSWDPMAAITDIGCWAKAAFPNAFAPGGPSLPSEPRFHHRFAGLVVLADWLGSHPHWFPVQEVDVADRLR
ncbi:MAG TPA: CRISPR-associated endonuclease Cas3'', partial [Clostridiales bacterium UBA8153]|nr:CRISPR-associated endonuclease Cas3'' [Clostridiales bacterium UBA8153]